MNLSDHLSRNHFLIFNNTRVIRARLLFQKPTGATVEIFCLEPADPAVVEQAMVQTARGTWKCLVGNLKRWKTGNLVLRCSADGVTVLVTATYRGKTDDGAHLVHFTWDPGHLTFAEILKAAGHIPLPPYIHREDTLQDLLRYQTIYAQNDGSVAAPTAGLHFTPEVLESLRGKGISWSHVTLHVGAGTFKPVTSPDIRDHVMHTEKIIVPGKTILDLLERRDKEIIAVGTTAARTLESLYWAGVKILAGEFDEHTGVGQWDPYVMRQSAMSNEQSALRAVVDYMDGKGIETFQTETRLMIVPGYRYRIVDGLITNFHMPGSTLLLLVAAMIGDDWKRAYEHALANPYRFLSYGDACLFLPGTGRK